MDETVISSIFYYGYFQKSDCNSVRCEVARLIQSLTQNNPSVQDIVLETDLLPSLLNILEETSASEVSFSYFISFSYQYSQIAVFLSREKVF